MQRSSKKKRATSTTINASSASSTVQLRSAYDYSSMLEQATSYFDCYRKGEKGRRRGGGGARVRGETDDDNDSDNDTDSDNDDSDDGYSNAKTRSRSNQSNHSVVAQVSLLFAVLTVLYASYTTGKLVWLKFSPSSSSSLSASTLSATPQERQAALRESYNIWKETHVACWEQQQESTDREKESTITLCRVVRSESDEDTVSEGIAYGMLLAAYLEDTPDLLEHLWRYAQLYLNEHGIMHWRIHANGTVLEVDGASDADQEMAMALLVADQKWGHTNQHAYRRAALMLIRSIWRYEVEQYPTLVLKPGDKWDVDVTNPSYYSPAYYRIFANYTGNAEWLELVDGTYDLLQNIVTRTGGSPLFPDWSTPDGAPAPNYMYDYGYDACRIPLRLVQDAVWFQEPRALQFLESMNAFWQSVGPDNIRDGYRLSSSSSRDGTSTTTTVAIGPNPNNAPFTTMAAAGSIVSDNIDFRNAMWNAGRYAWKDNYYSGSLHALGLLMASGNMIHPLQVKSIK